MKKIFTLLILLVATLQAMAFEVGNFSYQALYKGAVKCDGLSSNNNLDFNADIIIPTSVSYDNETWKVIGIAEKAFKDNAKIRSVTIHLGIATIEPNAFENCTRLTTAAIYSQFINKNAFLNCRNLTSVVIGEEAHSIYSTTFSGCSSLNSIKVHEDNTRFSSYEGALFDRYKNTLICMPAGKSDPLIALPASCTTIGEYAFNTCTRFPSIRIPYGVTEIKEGAFSGVSSATIIEIPSSVRSMGDKMFAGCSSLTDLYVNSYRVPSITKSSMFANAANPNLHVQRDLVDAFKSAGWKNFKSYNNNNVVPEDYVYARLGFTITSRKSENIKGNQYDGRARLVRGRFTSLITDSIVTVPTFITVNDKKYAVTRIEDLAFNIPGSYRLAGCGLVDTIGKQAFDSQKITSARLPYVSYIDEEAFDDCKSLNSVAWSKRLKHIGKWGFCNAPLTNDIILPVGFESLGYRPFQNSKSQNILLPSTLTTIDKAAFYNMKSLSRIIVNTPAALASSQSFDFTGVPSSATVLVPVGKQTVAKAHSNWKRFSNIDAGAFDFTRDGSLSNRYSMTVISTEPVVLGGGITCAGKAAYVYNSKVRNNSSLKVQNTEPDIMCIGDDRVYLMTEIGDSLCYGSSVSSISLENMINISRIGAKAFTGSKLKSALLSNSSSDVSFGVDAFYGATQLSELIIPGYRNISWDGRFIGNNASDFTLYINCYKIYPTLNSNLKNMAYNATEMCTNRVAPCFYASYSTQPLAAPVTLDLSDFQAYAITSDKKDAQGNLVTQRWYRIKGGDQGVILTGLTSGQLYKVKRYTSPVNSATNYLKAATVNTNVSNVPNTYYWSTYANRFLTATGDKFYVDSGECYLEFPSTDSDLYIDIFPKPTTKKGDVNDDGTIDVTDVNLTINVMLGKTPKSVRPGADVNGDGTVDVTDVNLIINLMLGK